MSSADLWIEDVRAAGEADPETLEFLARILRGPAPESISPLLIVHGEDGGLYAVGPQAASHLAALREVYQGTLGRLDRLEWLGRVEVRDETDLRRMVDEFPPADHTADVLAELAKARGEGEGQR